MTLGAEIRRLRLAADIPLRELARRLDISAAHQSDIEHSRRMPHDDLLRKTAKELAAVGASYEEFRKLDPRLEDDLENWMSGTPEVRQLLREAKDSGRSVREVLDEMRTLLRKRKED